MSPKTTILTALVLAGLVVYIYRYEREPIDPDTDSEREQVFEIEADQIQEIEIRRADGETLRLERSGEDAWQLLAPVQAPADASEADGLAGNIASLERERVVAEGELNLADYGLENPKLEVEFKTEDAETPTTVLLGDETPTTTNMYAKLADEDKVFVMAASLESSFDKKAWDLREKSVFHFSRDDVEEVVVKRPDGELVLARVSEDLWNVAKPSFTRADRYKASGLVSTLETSKMEEIVTEAAEDFAPYGLASPGYEVDIELKGGRSDKLLVGEEKGGRYFARNPDRAMVYLIGASLVDELKKDASEYISKRLFDFATYQVSKFQIAPDAGAARVFEKTKQDDEDVWAETAPEARDLDRTKVEDFLYKLNGTDADGTVTEGVAKLESYGLDRPAFTMTIWSKDGESVEEVVVGKPDGDSVYARRKGDELLLELSVSKWDEIENLMDFSAADDEVEGEKTEEEN
jgi:hypothetical protein